MDVVKLLGAHAENITDLRVAEEEPSLAVPWPGWVRPEIVSLFRSTGVDALWSHQAEAVELIHQGHHVVLATGTASGKSLAYSVGALEALAAGRSGSSLHGHRRPTVLYLAPTKALAADQLRRLPEGLDWLHPATVDGDNSREQRTWARDRANWILTNPDTLHHALLPSHERWSRVFGGLTHVIVDECHHYRGVFGAHVAHVLRRLRRIAAHHGAQPVFVLASATVAEPASTAERLIGAPVREVLTDGAGHGERITVFYEPPLLPGTEGAAPVRRSLIREGAAVLADLVGAQVRTLAFVRSRSGAERLAQLTQNLLKDGPRPELAERVATYRGGYLPEERRELEAQLRSGRLLGLAATNALELGIDVAGVDAVIALGYPGTRAGMLQQFGRAGRAGQRSLGLFMARDEPIDAFIVRHPSCVLDEPPEKTVFDPDNPYVLGPHLAAAAAELPLTEPDLELFGPRAAEGIAALTKAGLLRQRPRGWFWTSTQRASDLADLRSAGGRPVQIVESSTGRLVGTIDAASADSQVHTGAVYVHQQDSWVVEHYDREIAAVRREDVAYSTTAESSTTVSIVAEHKHQKWGPARVSFGDVDVTSRVTSYAVRDGRTGRVVSHEPLDLPARSLPTRAVWWTLPEPLLAETLANDERAGAAHAAEHASIGLLPLFATCDRWDIGGLSTALHPDTGSLTVFVHDGHPGGAGFAERGYEVASRWLRFTRDTIASCECSDGCPACVVSPKCGNGNQPLSKSGAVRLLDLVLGGCPGDAS